MKISLLAFIPLLFLITSHAAEYSVDPTTGYRMERYRGPVPDSVPGGKTVDNAFVADAVANNSVVLIDVYPPTGLGHDPIDGTWITEEIRETIPGSIWLPNVGRGHLEEEEQAYFTRNLELLSESDKTKALLFFCTSDCWQSWNAVVRASNLGYTNLYWYPLGSDGWAELQGDVDIATPVNFFGDE